jgi:hypothetical protein
LADYHFSHNDPYGWLLVAEGAREMSAQELADWIAEIKPSWLPISGHVVNITLSLDERDIVVRALREASLPTKALSQAEQRSKERREQK